MQYKQPKAGGGNGVQLGWIAEIRQKWDSKKFVKLTGYYLCPATVWQNLSMKRTLWLETEIKLVFADTVKLSNKEWFDKEQIGIKEPFPVTNSPFTS